MRATGRDRAVVTLPRAFVPEPQAVSSERLPGVMLTTALAVTLPLFAQCFYYLHEIPIPYYLSKAWPLMMAPLSLYAMIWLSLPGKRIYLIFLAYAMGFTPFISMVQLGNGLIDAINTTVKVWPLTYYFALSAMLAWLAPTYARTATVLFWLGATTFVLMLLLWLVVPNDWYNYDPELGKLFMNEEERGYRIYMPMFFGMLFLFYLTRRSMQQLSWLMPLTVIVGFVLLFTIYKQRTAITGAMLVCLYIVIVSLAPRLRLIVGGLVLAVAPLAIGYIVIENAQGLTASLGGSLTVRQSSLALATAFLGDDPWRWLVGVGGTTRFGSITLADIVGDANFYLTDLGWFGIVFEYGLIGALLLAGLYGWGLFLVLRAARGTSDPMVLALSDYILYMLATSAVYSLVFTPGEFAVAMALALYLAKVRGQAPPVPARAHRISFTVNRSRVRSPDAAARRQAVQ